MLAAILRTGAALVPAWFEPAGMLRRRRLDRRYPPLPAAAGATIARGAMTFEPIAETP
jgi:hypothetical protein